MIAAAILAALFASGHVSGSPAELRPDHQEKRMFDASSMDQLRFLEGRWSGTAPDGSIFYEAYDRPDPLTLRSQRFKDASFADVTDGSVVTLEDGEITSTWGEFVWKASEVSDGFAAFDPINAPSSFSWRKIDPSTVEVTQKWQDDQGVAQQYSLLLKRID